MKIIKGKGVSNGIAIGTIHFSGEDQVKVRRISTDNSALESSRFESARKLGVSKLKELFNKAVKEVGESNAQILSIHQMMLEDMDYLDSVRNIISTQKVNAEYAVAVTSDNFAAMFSDMDDEYMKARSADVMDISDRIIRNLSDRNTDNSLSSGKDLIICADDLTPSETVQMDKSSVIAFVTRKGSANSHTAILARTMAIPAIIGAGSPLEESLEGSFAIINAFTGEIFIDPDEATLSKQKIKQKKYLEHKELIKPQKGKENITADGKKIELYANIGSFSDLGEALKNDAGGIGLFRSEFLYLENDDYPSEEFQFSVYKKAAESMAGKPVIIRTMDIGADKQIEYFNIPKEENPALGWRALRICLDRQDIFKAQLRALCRASAFGNIQVMFPMVASLWEVQEIKAIVAEIQDSLKKEGIAFNEKMAMGIMIETPAAAVRSDILAPEVNFFSIGTNDLTQYTIAVDRQNRNLERYFAPYHPSVLRLIDITVQNAHKNGIWCGICGELGGDINMTEAFLAMGIDELSMAPGSILEIRKKIRETDTRKIDKEKYLNEH